MMQIIEIELPKGTERFKPFHLNGVETIDENKEKSGKGSLHPVNGFIDGEKKFWVSGSYQCKENRICVSQAHCPRHLKYFMEYLCDKFKTRHVLFYNIMNMSVWRLRGFNIISIIDPILDEVVTCLEGYWEENGARSQEL
jgi:hypothetical protein